MGKKLPPNKKTAGFTLVEVLIAFVVLSIGLLGAVALQAKAKKGSFDSLQRAAAIALANDIVQRMRANDTANLVNSYKKTISSKDTALSVTSCLNAQCSDLQMAAFDIEEWKKALKAKDNTGGLANAIVCIVPELVAGSTDQVDVEVIISWQGRNEIAQINDNKDVECGTNDKRRRLVKIDSFIFIRS